ncbi:MAG: 1-deoxy-D-xylulose-5-phosphate reductoisomerase [Planctomycetota bacterium]|jgi:1-deoxy-D-xylulose-5-phosphate reductoisomerase
MKKLISLGSTGSIGTQTLDLVRAAPELYQVEGLCAHSNWELMAEQVREFSPRVVGMVDEEAAERLKKLLPSDVALIRGMDSAEELASAAEYDLCVHGVVGAAGVRPSERVLERGKSLALANKESLVVAGEYLMELSRRNSAPILPVDSEHAAIYQCLQGEDERTIRKIYLTASGGALRDRPLGELDSVVASEALAHPTWSMGQRITIDSATLTNKALEIIEAHHLYNLSADQIQVVLHRQSVIHSMVEFHDGSVIAQMGPPDMRGPIHFALNHPRRVSNPNFKGFDMQLYSQLTFAEPDLERYPGLELGYRCVREGGDAGAVLNAADEVSVAAFLAGEIGFQDISRINRIVLDERPALIAGDSSIDSLLASDVAARTRARSAVDSAITLAK